MVGTGWVDSLVWGWGWGCVVEAIVVRRGLEGRGGEMVVVQVWFEGLGTCGGVSAGC